MTIETGLFFFLALLIFAVTPGPGVFAILATSMRHGGMASLPLSLGMAVSDVVYLIAACLGLAALAESGHVVFSVIRYVGAAYLIYLGWQMWRAPVVSMADASTAAAPALQRRDWGRGLMQGFLISASNPKVILFYLAFLPTFLDLSQLSKADIAVASVLAFTALVIGLMSIAALAATARQKLTSPHSAQMLNRSAGSIMAGAGVYLGAKAL